MAVQMDKANERRPLISGGGHLRGLVLGAAVPTSALCSTDHSVRADPARGITLCNNLADFSKHTDYVTQLHWATQRAASGDAEVCKDQ